MESFGGRPGTCGGKWIDDLGVHVLLHFVVIIN